VHDLLIYLLAMVVVVPLSKRLGLGSVIGYLLAGALIGPQGLALLTGLHDGTSELAEFGVIMMLLMIGLELNPKVLWQMRGPVFGLGSLQLLATLGAVAALALASGIPAPGAVAVGMILAVSSTAVALQSLQEGGYAKTLGGERAFAVLLFQDIAVIPMLAALAFLGAGDAADPTPAGRKALLVLGAVAAVIVAGRFGVRPLLKLIARVRLRETFTALSLLIVAGSAALMHAVGLSPALGAFLAGVVLAESEFRHQIESDIEPFKSLLLGLFFITIGTSIRFDLIAARPGAVAAVVAGLIALKAAIVYAIGRGARMRPPESLLFAASLAQGGEFAFVLIAQARGLLPGETGQLLTAAVALSMAAAPLVISLAARRGMALLDRKRAPARAPDTVAESEKDNPVLVIGIGRFGQTLIRFLRACGYRATVLDIDSEQIDVIARFGIKSYFGDGSSLDLLRAAGLERCRALVVAIDEQETALRIVETVHQAYPQLPIFSRVYDRIHAYRMIPLGVREVAVETSGSALFLGGEVLKALGVRPERVETQARLFQANNQRSIHHLARHYHEDDDEAFLAATRQQSEQLDAMLRSDPEELLRGVSSEWTPPGAKGTA
jgi:monovalent cation:proton antiporter-2 (CPA2) family protein